MIVWLNVTFDSSGLYNDDLDEKFNRFYKLPKNTTDVLFFGTSAVFEFVIPEVIWKNEGISSYTVTTNGEPLNLTRYMIENALNYQSPELIVIDLHGLFMLPGEFRVARNYDSISMLPFSPTKLSAISSMIEYNEGYIQREGILSCYFPFVLFHSRWKSNLGIYDFKKVQPEGLGYIPVGSIQPQNNPIFSTEILLPENEMVKTAFFELIDYCDTLDRNVIFIMSPWHRDEFYYQNVNWAVQFLQDNGYSIVNFNNEEMMYGEVGLISQLDYSDPDHTNVSGAIKYSNYIADYLKNNYDLPDHRGDSSFAIWDNAYRRFAENADKNWNDQWGSENRPFAETIFPSSNELDVMPEAGVNMVNAAEDENGIAINVGGRAWSLDCTLPAGEYTYEFWGQNFTDANFIMTVQGGAVNFETTDMQRTDGYVTFNVAIPAPTREAIAGCFNVSQDGDKKVRVTGIRLTRR